MIKKQKLELTWIGKENRPKLEPRILLEDPAKSYHAAHRVTANDLFDNKLIFGDNLLALKALEQQFAGKIKCIFIDPPYNTGSAFEHYEDGLEHSLWLSLMRERLELLSRLLRDDGSLWITIDDNEAHYLKVLCDEVFGRKNFLCTVVWQKKYAPKADSKFLSESQDFILVVAKNIEALKLNRLPKTEKQTSRYTNRDNDPRGPWKAGDVLRNEVRDYAIFPVKLPSGREVMPPAGTSWRYIKEKFAEMIADNRIWFGVDGDSRPAVKRFISEVTDTIPATTWWEYSEVGHNDEAKKESKELFGDALFGTPKPERLMERIVMLASNPGEWVLDSFGGSGIRAINELKPMLGLEVTATPFTETGKGATPFKNVVYDYPLARALADGFVKEPAVVTQRNFDAALLHTIQETQSREKERCRQWNLPACFAHS